MGRPHRPEPVKLFCGMLSCDEDLLRRARQLLVRRYGPVDLESEIWPFTQTDYYAEEMGASLSRCFVSFERLIAPDRIAEIKNETNVIEDQLTEDCIGLDVVRPVNLDPGYVHPDKLVLATTKDAGHRIPIGQRMYAEVTLRHGRGGWQLQPWTYPDYRQAAYHEFFEQVRGRLLDQRQARHDGD